MLIAQFPVSGCFFVLSKMKEYACQKIDAYKQACADYQTWMPDLKVRVMQGKIQRTLNKDILFKSILTSKKYFFTKKA